MVKEARFFTFKISSAKFPTVNVVDFLVNLQRNSYKNAIYVGNICVGIEIHIRYMRETDISGYDICGKFNMEQHREFQGTGINIRYKRESDICGNDISGFYCISKIINVFIFVKGYTICIT